MNVYTDSYKIQPRTQNITSSEYLFSVFLPQVFGVAIHRFKFWK